MHDPVLFNIRENDVWETTTVLKLYDQIRLPIFFFFFTNNIFRR